MESDGRDAVLLKKVKDSSLFSNFTELLVSFHYDQADEIDLLVVYKTKEPARYGLVYFGDLGSLNDAPFILLENEPNDRIARVKKFDNIDTLWFVLLDYESVSNKADSTMLDGLLNVVDNSENEYNFELSFNQDHNMYVVGKVDNTGDTTKFLKLEDEHKLESFEKLSDLLDCLN